jgi:hypothetical protein
LKASRRTSLLISLTQSAGIFSGSAIVVLRFVRVARSGSSAATASVRIAGLRKRQLCRTKSQHCYQHNKFKKRHRFFLRPQFASLSHVPAFARYEKGQHVTLFANMRPVVGCRAPLVRDVDGDALGSTVAADTAFGR